MALGKQKKQEVVQDVSNLLSTSKLTVMAAYAGTPVKALQQLRRDSRTSGTTVRVIKNRMVIKALEGSDKFKDIDTSVLRGMLLYAFNSGDEAAPAQNLAEFAKTQPSLQFVGGFSADGQFISADDVAALAALPSKDQLRAQLAGTLKAPFSGLVGVMSANLRSLVTVLNARIDKLGAT